MRVAAVLAAEGRASTCRMHSAIAESSLPSLYRNTLEKERFMNLDSHSARAERLGLTLTAYHTWDGHNLVRVSRGAIELAHVADREVGPWLAAQAAHLRHAAATASR